MKSIADFLSSKLRRMESKTLQLSATPPDQAQLGAPQATLQGPGGSLHFHEEGLVTEDGRAVRYDSLERVLLEPAEGELADVQLLLNDNTALRFKSSKEGGEAVYATLRWIGNVKLRRKIAD